MPSHRSRQSRDTLAHVTFFQDGSIQPTVEALPDSQDDLEGVIAAKFAARLQLHYPDLRLIQRVPPHDACLSLGSETVDVELVSVLDDDIRHRRALRNEYCSEVRAQIEMELAALRGLVIEFHDDYQETVWPSPRSRSGQRLLAAIVQGFRRAVPALMAVEVGRVFILELYRGPSGYVASIYGHRIDTQESGRRPELTCNEIFPTSARVREGLLAAKVITKIEKNYAASTDRKLWLVAYAAGGGFAGLDMRAIAQARRILRRLPHPFDQVWTFNAMAEPMTGDARCIWPSYRRTTPNAT